MKTILAVCVLGLALLTQSALAADATLIRIQELAARLDSLERRVTELKLGNAAQAIQIAALKHANIVLAKQIDTSLLGGKLALSTDGKTATFTGVNVQIVNGLGTTATTNGVGNRLVGYAPDPAHRVRTTWSWAT
jgi:hypothetical protein